MDSWPTWKQVLPLLTVIAALAGGLYAVLQISDRTVREAVALSAVESSANVNRMRAELTEDLKGVEARLGDRMDRMSDRMDKMEARMTAMEARLLEAIRENR